jgi:hypothetical protein
MNKMNVFRCGLLSAAGLGVAAPSFAAGVDLSTLTAAVDFSSTNTAVLSVAASLIVVYITWKAAKLVIHAVKGG